MNLVAGQGRCKEIFPNVRSELDRRGLEYDLHVTNEPLEAADVAQMVAEKGFTHIVAMGGDGTILLASRTANTQAEDSSSPPEQRWMTG